MPDRDRTDRPVKVEFQPFGRRVSAAAHGTVLEAAREAGLGLLAVCGGIGLCETCRVRIVRGEVSAPSAHEREVLSGSEIEAGDRLACQVSALGDVVVEVPAESVGSEQRLQLESDSMVAIDEEHAGRAIAPGPPRFAFAADIGTTKIAGYLVDLGSRRTVARQGEINPQVTYGEDVVSRIAYADRNTGGAQALHGVLVASLNTILERLCTTASVLPVSVVDAVLVGNTAMHHFACGLPVAQLGHAPYVPAVTGALDVTARDFGLAAAPDAHVYLPPNVAGYVGADHVAVLVAVGVPAEGRTRLVIDIGTNTEISLFARNRVVTCSCASGPAFEGAHIGCGMRAAAGAIERLRLVGGHPRFQTVGGRAPIGICGSGVLDAVAELASHGALDRHGGFVPDHPLFARRGGDRVFVLAAAGATGHNRELVLTRGDVTEIQLAKAAIRAGIDLLLAHAGVAAESIDEVIVAGAFGTYIDLASARRIGMLPDLPASRFRQVGNAAGAGARQMALSVEPRRAAESLAGRVEYLDLSGHPRFMDTFAAALGFSRGEQACDLH